MIVLGMIIEKIFLSELVYFLYGVYIVVGIKIYLVVNFNVVDKVIFLYGLINSLSYIFL